MKTDLEMTNEILQQVRERRAAQKKRRAVLFASAGALAVVTLAVGVVYGTALHRKPDAETTACTELATSPALGTGDSAPQPGGAETVPDGFGGSNTLTPTIGLPPGSEVTAVSVGEPPSGTTVGVTGGTVTTTAVPTVEYYETTGTSQAGGEITTPAHPPVNVTTTQNCTTSAILSGGNSYLYRLPERAAREQLERSGEKLTDEQAQAYFKENLTWLQSALSASGVPADALRISERGYSHVMFENYNAAPAAPVCALHQNFRDYPVWNGDELVAIVTLVLENGELHATPAFGGPWFSAFGDFLNMHKGEKLLFLYFGGQTEFVLTPDGKVRNVQGQELAPDFGEIKNPYDFFYCPEAVYVP